MFCGKRSLLLMAFLVAAAVSVAQAIEVPVAWFEDDFESYPDNTRLRQAAPNWTDGGGPENRILTFADDQAVRLKGTSGTGATSSAVTATSWAAESAGNFQILAFTLQSDLAHQSAAGNHLYVELDHSAGEIGRWYGWSNNVAPRVGSNVGPGVDITDGAVHDFAITYDPATGDVEWLHNDAQQYTFNVGAGLASESISVQDIARDTNDYVWLDDVVVGTVLPPGLTWDGADSTWSFGSEPGGDPSHWAGGGPDDIPTAAAVAVIDQGICTLDDPQGAAELWVLGDGTFNVAATGELTVVGPAHVTEGASLAVEGSLTADSLRTSGTNSALTGTIELLSSLIVESDFDASGATLSLGSADVTVEAGTFTVPGLAAAAATVNTGGTLSVLGELAVESMTIAGGSSALAGGTAQNLSVDGGSLTTSAQLNVHNMTFAGGVVDTATTQVEIQDGGSLAIADTTFSIAGATLGVTGSDLSDNVVRLGGGTMTVVGSGPPDQALNVTTFLEVTGDATLALGVQSGDGQPPFPSVSLAKLTLDLGLAEALTVRLEPPVVAQADRSASIGELAGSGALQWSGGVGQFSVEDSVSPGGSGSGQLSIGGDLTMEPGSVYQWGVDTAGVDALVINGRLDLAPGGSWTLKLVHGEAPIGPVEEVEPIPVASYNELVGDSLGVNGVDYFIDTSQAENWVFAGGVPSLDKDLIPGSVALVWLEEVLALQWKTDADGSYNDPGNWFNQALPNGVDAEANFLNDIPFTGDRQVTVDEPVTVGAINFRNGDWSYTLAKSADAGDVITLQTSIDDPQINVVEGHHTIEAPLAFTAVTINTEANASLTLAQAGYLEGNVAKTGEGTLVLPAGFSMKGGVQVDQGVVEASSGVFALEGGDLGVGATGTLKVVGDVNRLVSGVPGDTGLGVVGSILELTGFAEIGLVTETDGYVYQGALEVGPHFLGLEDADEAPLYGAHMAGGTISSFNGIRLLPINVADGLNSRLYGFGTVNGNVVAGIEGNPTPAVVVADPGQTIAFTGVVQTGNSTFVNNVVITGTERLGFSPAVGMKLGGAPIGPDAVVEVYGTAGADFVSEIPDALAPPVADPVSGYGQFYVAGGQSLVSGKITLSTGGSDYVGRGGDTFELIVTGQAWLMDFTQFPPQNVLLPQGSVNIDPGFIVDTSGIPLASPGLFWQEFRSDQGLTLKIVPEPGTLVLLLTGGLALFACAWRRRRAAGVS